MDFFGVGPLELFFIVLIALIVLGPRDMVKAGRTLGGFLRTIVKSDAWRAVQSITKDMRNLPNRLMREAGIEEDAKNLVAEAKTIRKELDMSQVKKEIESAAAAASSTEAPTEDDPLAAWTTAPNEQDQPGPEPTIAPPQARETQQDNSTKPTASE